MPSANTARQTQNAVDVQNVANVIAGGRKDVVFVRRTKKRRSALIDARKGAEFVEGMMVQVWRAVRREIKKRNSYLDLNQ